MPLVQRLGINQQQYIIKCSVSIHSSSQRNEVRVPFYFVSRYQERMNQRYPPSHRSLGFELFYRESKRGAQVVAGPMAVGNPRGHVPKSSRPVLFRTGPS